MTIKIKNRSVFLFIVIHIVAGMCVKWLSGGGDYYLWREIQPIVMVVRDALWLLEEKKPEMGVIVFLFQLALHTFGCCTEEKVDEVFIGAFISYLTEGIDVCRTILDIDDE